VFFHHVQNMQLLHRVWHIGCWLARGCSVSDCHGCSDGEAHSGCLCNISMCGLTQPEDLAGGGVNQSDYA
jgi:hypothetical protein